MTPLVNVLKSKYVELTPKGSTLSHVIARRRSTTTGCPLGIFTLVEAAEGEAGGPLLIDSRLEEPPLSRAVMVGQSAQLMVLQPLLDARLSRDSGTQKRMKRTSETAIREARVITKLSL